MSFTKSTFRTISPVLQMAVRGKKVMCTLPNRLDGKLVLVSGASMGLGFETAGQLAIRGARVVMTSRDIKRAESAKQKLIERYGSGGFAEKQTHLSAVKPDQFICKELDLCSVKSIRKFTDQMLKENQNLDILVNNAGVVFKFPEYDEIGLETQVKTNYLGPFLMTKLLRPLLDASKQPRVINVSSVGHMKGTLNLLNLCRPEVGWCYWSSKVMNILHAKELSKRWGPGLVAASLHPGVSHTFALRQRKLAIFLIHTPPTKWLARSALEGSQTAVHCCVDPALIAGMYYFNCKPYKVNKIIHEPGIGAKLWDETEKTIDYWIRKTEK